VLSAEADNAGFYAWVHGDDVRAIALRTFVLQFPHLIVYGEWLVPHTLKTYREDAWRRFYVFDVFSRVTKKYLPYGEYAEGLNSMGIDVIPPLAIIENPGENQLAGLRDTTNTYLIQDDCGVGEGIILKNYEWANKHGHQPWSKVVRNEFKENNAKVFGMKPTQGAKQVEQEIVTAFCTPEFIRKEFAKVVLLVSDEVEPDLRPWTDDERDMFIEKYRHKVIPRFLGTVYLEFIQEEVRAFVKKFKNPVVDFSKLQKLVTLAAKRTMKDIF
jgi:ATP-dependent RNA circularization protein (DNA/RNA ligase family)